MNLDIYRNNSEWELVTTRARRESIWYKCCHVAAFDSLTFEIELRRVFTLHIRLFLGPIMMLCVVLLALFWIPVQRPDRITLGKPRMIITK